MGSPKPPAPAKLPKPVDQTAVMLNALQFSETEKKLRASSGRKSTLLTTPQVFSANPKGSLLGQ